MNLAVVHVPRALPPRIFVRDATSGTWHVAIRIRNAGRQADLACGGRNIRIDSTVTEGHWLAEDNVAALCACAMEDS